MESTAQMDVILRFQESGEEDEELFSPPLYSSNSSHTKNCTTIEQYEMNLQPKFVERPAFATDTLFRCAQTAVLEVVENFMRDREKEFYTFDPVLVARGVSKRGADQCFYEALTDYYVAHELQGDIFFITALSSYDHYAAVAQSLRQTVRWTWKDRDVKPVWGLGVSIGSTWRYPCGAVRGPESAGLSIEHCAAVFDVRVGQVSPRVVRVALNPYVGKEALYMQYITVLHYFKDRSTAVIQWERRPDIFPGKYGVKAALDVGVVPISAATKTMYGYDAESDGEAAILPAVPVQAWVRHAVVRDDVAQTAFNTRYRAHDRRPFPTADVWYLHPGAAGRPILRYAKARIAADLSAQGDYDLDVGELYHEAFAADADELTFRGTGDPQREGLTVAEWMREQDARHDAKSAGVAPPLAAEPAASKP